jgi:hypothetical protein
MKKVFSLYALALTLVPTFIKADCNVLTQFAPRTQSNLARALAGMTNHIVIDDMEKFYGTVAITPSYTRSFDDQHIAQCLFGNSLNECAQDAIRVTGSSVANRGANDWLADYFGLPTDFQSTVAFNPSITNYLLDFYIYIGLDEWLCGLFAFVYGPVVHTRWNLNACEFDVVTGSFNYPQGYFTPEMVSRSVLRNNFLEFSGGCQPLDLGEDIIMENLQYGRIDASSHHDTALADLRFCVGWNFFQDEDYHLGLGLLAAAPTGSRPKGTLLFEPIVGNGHHWELGAMLWGHTVFWRSECEERFFAGWIQANITHLFTAHQYRFFDLNCRPNSRYTLAERMDTPVTLLLADETFNTIGGTAPANQFKNQYAPVANLTGQKVDVSVGAQADIVLMLSYTSCSFTWDVGYNFWARSCQVIKPNCDCPPRLLNQKWALKGNSYVYGFSETAFGTSPVLPAGTPVALSATQSTATIYNGTNTTTIIDSMTVNANRNPGVDNRQWATAGESQTAETLLLFQPSGNPADQTNTSKDPILLTIDDIDYKAGESDGMSQKIFTHFSYAWLDNEDWTPYIGVGGEVEFSNDKSNCHNESCDVSACAPCNATSCPTMASSCNRSSECQRCSLTQWGIWIKGGISFN